MNKVQMAKDLVVLNKLFIGMHKVPVTVGIKMMDRYQTLTQAFYTKYEMEWLMAKDNLINNKGK
jgi:hypothetical protein